ncbi:MAG: cupin domain-containing protein [Rubrobacter sp.]|nr:cupin domain-containing protein [Rubrobacter sp.]
MDLEEAATGAVERNGTVWTLEGSEDLNANLIRFSSGGVGEHVNEEVDVIMVGITGLGVVTVGDEERRLSAGKLVFIPRGERRSVRSASDELAYLSVHRRRGPIQLGRKEESNE